MSIYKSTLNTSKQKKEKNQKDHKIKTKPSYVINISKYLTIILLIISAISFVGLCSPNNFIKSFMLGLMGISAYPFFLLCAFLCIMSLGKTKYEVNKK